MIEKKIWECEFCKAHYDSKPEVLKCESLHKATKNIEVIYQSRDTYPQKIKVAFADRTQRTYFLNRDYDDED